MQNILKALYAGLVAAAFLFSSAEFVSAEEVAKPKVSKVRNNCRSKCEKQVWVGYCALARIKIISVSKAICQSQYDECVSNCK